MGGDSVIPVDIRVIGATNRDLMERVEKESFAATYITDSMC